MFEDQFDDQINTRFYRCTDESAGKGNTQNKERETLLTKVFFRRQNRFRDRLFKEKFGEKVKVWPSQ